MNYTVLSYIIYLVASIGITIWVAKTLHKNGRIFLIESFGGKEELADSVNHLLIVGFYLINLGFVSLHLKQAYQLENTQAVFESLSTKMGTVLLVLGAMHFFNIYLFSKMRKRGELRHAQPPVLPQGHVAHT